MTAHVKYTPKRKPGFFQLPSPKLGGGDQKHKAFLSAMVTSIASDERVLEQTPSLKRLYEFLGSAKK